MADEAALLSIIAEKPDDGDARLVYADWLEGQGDIERATVVRLAHQLSLLAFDDPALIERGRELIALAYRLPVTWLAALTHPTLAHTTWATRDENERVYLLGFLPDGVLVYRSGTSPSPGRWLQIGAAVVIEVNDYSSREGVVIGERMRGVAGNDANNTWWWELVRLADPTAIDRDEMPELPPQPRDSDLVVDAPLAEALTSRRRR